MQYLDRVYTSQDWITLLLLCCIVITTIVKIAYPLRFQEFLKLPLSNKYFFVFGKNDAIYHLFNVLLFIPQAICVSLLLYKVIAWQNPTMLLETSFLFIKILGGFTGFVLAKIILEKTIGIIFNIENIIHQYVYQKLSYRNLMSILFIIMLFVVAYIAPINKSNTTYILSYNSSYKRNCTFLQLQNQRKINNSELLLFYFVSLRSGNFALHHTLQGIYVTD